MKRDKGTGLRSPVRMPWWVSVIIAVCCHCGLKYLVPTLHPANPFLLKLAQAAPAFASIATIPLLLLAAKQLYDPNEPPENGTSGNENGDSEDGPKG